MITLLAFIFVLGVLVFVHELGHFLAAKRVGIRVLKFQLGFNPTVLSFRRGDTEYGIGALPLGGYVKMAGENPDEERTGQSDEFLSKSMWPRFQVLIMGPTMNILLAFVVTAVILLVQGEERSSFEKLPPVVGVVAAGLPAEKADVRVGDLIVSVRDHKVGTWSEFFKEIALQQPNSEVALGLQRNGQDLSLKVTPVLLGGGQSRFEIGDIGVLPNVHPHLASVTPGDPGDRGGLKGGDVILAVNGQPMTFHYQMRELIAKNPEKPLTVSVLRGGVSQTLTRTPDKRGPVGFLGVRPVDDTISSKPGFTDAIRESALQNVEYGGLIFRTLWGLLTRETSPRQL